MVGSKTVTPLGLESVTGQTELKSTRDLIVELEAAARGVLSTRAQRTFFRHIAKYFPPVRYGSLFAHALDSSKFDKGASDEKSRPVITIINNQEL